MRKTKVSKANNLSYSMKMPRRGSLFWDVDPKTVNPQKHARYIIERILDFGTDKEARWMWNTYSKSLVRDVVKKSRILHPPTRALWQALTAINK